MENKLLLPRVDDAGRPYLSYSQASKWKRNKRDYIRVYFLGEPDNPMLAPYGDFGHLVGHSLENNDFSKFTPKEQEFMKSLPRYDLFEREIRLELDGFYVKGFIDTIKKDLSEQIDYKTGDIEKRSPEYEDDDYNQLGVYAAAIEQETGVIPKTSKVVLIGRSGNAFNGEDLKLTREVSIIEKTIDKDRVEQVKREMQSIAEDISAHYRVFLKLSGKL